MEARVVDRSKSERMFFEERRDSNYYTGDFYIYATMSRYGSSRVRLILDARNGDHQTIVEERFLFSTEEEFDQESHVSIFFIRRLLFATANSNSRVVLAYCIQSDAADGNNKVYDQIRQLTISYGAHLVAGGAQSTPGYAFDAIFGGEYKAVCQTRLHRIPRKPGGHGYSHIVFGHIEMGSEDGESEAEIEVYWDDHEPRRFSLARIDLSAMQIAEWVKRLALEHA